MNGKKAKSLRKATGFVPAAPRQQVNTTVKTVMDPMPALDAQGNVIMRPNVSSTVTNVVGTARENYQSLKKLLKW